MGDNGYALDLLSPVRHVATMLDGAAPAALSVSAMADTYDPLPGDLSRIREHEHQPTNAAATVWLIRRAVQLLTRRGESGEVQVEEVDGGYRLTVPFDELRYQGKKLARAIRENDEDARRELRKVYADLATERPFWVQVQGPRGGVEERRLYLHSLARAIPQVSEKEFGELAADVKARGVRNPITLFNGQVLDGRHRLAVASALKVPLRVTDFDGDEDAARREVVSQNVARRHLTVAQRALIVQELFLKQAEAEAEKRAEEGRQRGGEVFAGREASAHKCAQASEPEDRAAVRAKEVAVKRSGGLASVRTMQTMDPVRHAPQTQEKIRSGKIASAAVARREALKEQGRDPHEPTSVALPQSDYTKLGRALNDVTSVYDNIGGERPGGIGIDKIHARAVEIRDVVAKLIDKAAALMEEAT